MPKTSLRPERAKAIAELAESVADFYFPNVWIDPERLLERLGVTLSFGNYGECFDGMLEWRGSGFHVYCNLETVGNRTSNRARFTLAHELGHYVIDSHRAALESGRVPAHPSHCTDYQPELVVEMEANHFASHLLMPRERVVKVVDPGKRNLGIYDIQAIQRAFQVSFQSAAICMIQLASPSFIAGVMWRRDGKSWRLESPLCRARGYELKRATVDSLPPDCATRRCLDLELELPESSVTLASFWFRQVWPGSQRDILLRESSVRLGHYGAFTILTPENAPPTS